VTQDRGGLPGRRGRHLLDGALSAPSAPRGFAARPPISSVAPPPPRPPILGHAPDMERPVKCAAHVRVPAALEQSRRRSKRPHRRL